MQQVIRFLILSLLPLSLVGCVEPIEEVEALPFDHWFELSVGEEKATVQLAITATEKSHGLMERTDLRPHSGMLFVQRLPGRASFWMKNTPLPLDIGFFDPDGILLEVHKLFPFDSNSVHSESSRVQYALEMNQGWFTANGVKPGAALDLYELASYLQSRGFDTKDYGNIGRLPKSKKK